jgi:hypothetical protein
VSNLPAFFRLSSNSFFAIISVPFYDFVVVDDDDYVMIMMTMMMMMI